MSPISVADLRALAGVARWNHGRPDLAGEDFAQLAGDGGIELLEILSRFQVGGLFVPKQRRSVDLGLCESNGEPLTCANALSGSP